MNKMDDFLKKRLKDHTPAEDGWNIPSDELWNKAKPHFPKKKKRRWPLVMLFVGVGLLLGVGFYVNKNVFRKQKMATIDSTTKLKENTEKEHQTPSNQSNELNATTITVSPTNIKEEKKNKAIENQNAKTKAEIGRFEKAPNQKKTGVPSEEIISTISPKKADPIVDLLVLDRKEERGATEYSLTKSENGFVEEFDESLEEINKEGEEIAFAKFNKNVEELTPLNTALNSFEIPAWNLTKVPKIEIPKKKFRPTTKREIGISHSGNLLKLLDVIDINDPETGTSILVDFRNPNANLFYTKWWRKKWSLTTGLAANSFDLDFDLSVFVEATQEDIDRYILNDYIQYRLVAAPPSNPDDLKIRLIPGAEVIAGDSVNIQTRIRQKGQSFMVPLFLNYHVYKNKFEWIYSFGAALDVANIDLDEDTFELHKNGRLISEPITDKPLEGLFIQPHFITKIGLRYHINEKLNVGWSSSINFTNIPLSNMDLGLYYRF